VLISALVTGDKIAQYQETKDWPLQDNAHGKAAKHACSFSSEENGCGIPIYPFSSYTCSSSPGLWPRANMSMRCIKMLGSLGFS